MRLYNPNETVQFVSLQKLGKPYGCKPSIGKGFFNCCLAKNSSVLSALAYEKKQVLKSKVIIKIYFFISDAH